MHVSRQSYHVVLHALIMCSLLTLEATVLCSHYFDSQTSWKNTPNSLFSVPSIPCNPVFHSQYSPGIALYKLPLPNQSSNSVVLLYQALSLWPYHFPWFSLLLALTCSLSLQAVLMPPKPFCFDFMFFFSLLLSSSLFSQNGPLVITYTCINTNIIVYIF